MKYLINIAKKCLYNDTQDAVREKFNLTFSPRQDNVFNKTCSYPLASEEGMEMLIASAQKLLDMHPTGKIISLGQSPAWLVTTAALIDHTSNRFDGVAFSGGFYDAHNLRLVRRKEGPTLKQISAYREYLTQKGMHPLSICQEFSKENPLVIVEHTHTGTGLTSFLWLYVVLSG